MTCLSALCLLLAPPTMQLEVRDVISSVREAQKNVRSYEVFGEVIKDDVNSRVAPTRPKPLPLPVPEHRIAETFEDRFDFRLGRTCFRFVRRKRMPSSALMIEADGSESSLSDFLMRDSVDDLLQALAPHYRDFDLLDTLESHPETRARTDGEFVVVEIPVESLREFDEFGARILVSPKAGFAIAGCEVYLRIEGQESLIRRVDARMQQVTPEAWLPNRIVSWTRSTLPTLNAPTPTDAKVLQVDIAWKGSAFGEPLQPQQLVVGEYGEMRHHRRSLGDNLTLVNFRPAPPAAPEAQHFHGTLLLVHVVCLVIFILLYFRNRPKTA